MSCTYLGKQIWSDIYGKKNHDYRFLFAFIYMFSFRLQEKIFMIKPYDDVIYHVLNMM